MFPYRGTSKRPRTAHGHHDATCDVETVARWWRWHPLDNIGARLPAGLVVLDLDRHGDDESRHCRWRPEDFAETLTTETGTGWHLWYAATPGELRATSELPGWQGTELNRHAVVIPPSVHANGKRYTWRRAPIARLPALVADAFWRRPAAISPASEPTDAYVRAARAGVVADLATVAGPGNPIPS